MAANYQESEGKKIWQPELACPHLLQEKKKVTWKKKLQECQQKEKQTQRAFNFIIWFWNVCSTLWEYECFHKDFPSHVKSVQQWSENYDNGCNSWHNNVPTIISLIG